MKIMEENDKNKILQVKLKEKERLKDVASQEAYARMLDRQEQDRKNEINAREKRAQDFMNRMADGVLKEMDKNQQKEDEMIEKYMKVYDLKERKKEEDKEKKRQAIQEDINRTLANQQHDKAQREQELKSFMNEQGAMWEKEREIWSVEDARIQQKIKTINKENASFLKMQEEEKRAKGSKKMVDTEKQLNKNLMKEIKQKKKSMIE